MKAVKNLSSQLDLTNPVPIPGDLLLPRDEATIVTVLRHRARIDPHKRAFIFLANGEEETGSLTFAQLDRGARNIALKLLALEMKDKPVLMFYPPGPDFILAFFGCLYAGAVPAAAYPPRKNRSMHRIRTMAEDCGAQSILTTEAIARSLERNFAEDPLLAGLTWHTTNTWEISDETAVMPAEPGFESLAFLQYTSGSSGNPKGVMVSHRNIMYNLRSLQLIFRITPDDIAVHWVPQFHDLGLIFGILETVFSGSSAMMIPPFIFIANPFCLLQTISRYRATVSGQPDFAFNHCVDKIDETRRKELDLSSLRVMYSGAEPVRKSTFDRFLSAFSGAGLKPETLIPAYGMAESTLILTGAKETGPTVYLPVSTSALEKNLVVPASKDDPPGDIQWIASNGKPTMDTSILIVDPETDALQQPYRIGEIWAAGSTITLGYYGRKELTDNVFRVSPTGGDNPVWLRTGDLGFIYHGELFITGRLKDLIIVHGRNFYPQDIEEVVETSHPSIRKSCSAAFPVDSGGRERLAIVAELRRTLLPPDTGKIVEDIVAAISREFELQPARVTLIKTGALIKTSSGKIMRNANRESLLAGRFEAIADRTFEEPEALSTDPGEGGITNLEQFLMAWTSLRLNKGRPVDPANSLPSYGIDSIRAVELTEETKNIFGFEWPPYLFFEEISIARLAVEGMKIKEEG